MLIPTVIGRSDGEYAAHPDRPRPAQAGFFVPVIVTAHQLNFLPGVSVIERIRRADAVIWLDAAQYVRHSWVNRNRFSPDEKYMTVPVNEHDTYAPINRVRIADPQGHAREKIARTLEHRLGRNAAPFAAELRRGYQLLAGLNHALIGRLLDELGIRVEHHFQSMLDPLHAVPAWSASDEPLEPVRERFADMAAQLGATVWLSGPSRHHGDPASFAAQGIRIDYYEHGGPNPCAVDLVRGRLAEAA